MWQRLQWRNSHRPNLNLKTEALQQIGRIWEDFREERDAYILKEFGYKHPIHAIMTEGEHVIRDGHKISGRDRI